jgi:regulator of RNase E activity RraA
MTSESDVASMCAEIAASYSPCDVSDALLKLQVLYAGYLRDITPLPTRHGSTARLVAPISTVLFVDRDHNSLTQYEGMIVPTESNIAAGKHFADVAPAGSVVIMQQPSHQIAALMGDIVATRFKVRGIKGCFIDGRARDMTGCAKVCEDGKFQCWSSRKPSSVGTSLEAKPWAVDVPLQVGGVIVHPGDILVADEAEMVCCVIPRDKLKEVVELLPGHKEADNGILKDVEGGMEFKESIKRWPKHYSNH